MLITKRQRRRIRKGGERITDLIRNVNSLKTEEWTELIAGLRWADELFQANLRMYPCNIVFRRGGKLQNYILLRGTRWEKADISRLQPKLQLFLTAEYSAIKQTFEQNEEVKRIIRESPELFCESPERALQLQEEWLSKVEDYPGLRNIQRTAPEDELLANELFGREIIEYLLPLFNAFDLKTVVKRRVFISYSRKDEWFADKLEGALSKRGVGVWIDKKEILVGDSLIQRIREGINTAQYICAVISKNSINSKWVQEELDLAMNQQIEDGKVRVLPIVIESKIELPSFL